MIAELLEGRSADTHPGWRWTRQLHRHPRGDRRRARAGDRMERAACGNVLARPDRCGREGQRCRGGRDRRPWRAVRPGVRAPRESRLPNCAISPRPKRQRLQRSPRSSSDRALASSSMRADGVKRARLGPRRRMPCSFPRAFATCRPSRSTLGLPTLARRKRPDGDARDRQPKCGCAPAIRATSTRSWRSWTRRSETASARRGPVRNARDPADGWSLRWSSRAIRPTATSSVSRLSRTVADESELLLLAVLPTHQGAALARACSTTS